MKRRNLLKGLAGIPILGAYSYFMIDKLNLEEPKKITEFQKFIRKKNLFPKVDPVSNTRTKKLRIGIIGAGARGTYLMRALGFMKPAGVAGLNEKAYKIFQDQPDLNIEITGVCDLYEPRVTSAILAASNKDRKKEGTLSNLKIKKYKDFKDLVTASDVDAVVIATADHWHAPIIIAAAKAGKHVYSEKALANSLDDVFKVKTVLQEQDVVFQLGHQNRQIENYKVAANLVQAGMLGKVNLVETSTNRNSKNGAWLYPIPEDAGPHNLDWKRFLRDNDTPFNKEHFFRWRLFWDYGTGLVGDLMTHEYDAVNQILKMGIPEKVTATGGIYHWKDNREVPDVQQILMEFPNQDFSMVYSASLGNDLYRPRKIMGDEAALEMGGTLNLTVDRISKKYKKFIDRKEVVPGQAIELTEDYQAQLDAISSATEQYFASRGLLYSKTGNSIVDTTHLHLAEWLHAIRTGAEVSCGVDEAFEEGITAMMAIKAYREEKMIKWDGENVFS